MPPSQLVPLTYDAAYYWDETGKRQCILAESLGSLQERTRAVENELFDADGITRLCLVDATTRRKHFSLPKGSSGPRIVSTERTQEHDKRVHWLERDLQTFKSTWTLLLDAGAPDNVRRYRLPPYAWGREVTRTLNAGFALRHDVYGARLSLQTSPLVPSVAIEVIDTHYPDEEAFAAMLHQSATSPHLVLFENLRRRGSFVKAQVKEKTLYSSKWSFVVRDGAVWHRGQLTGITTAAAFQLSFNELLNRWDAHRAKTEDTAATARP